MKKVLFTVGLLVLGALVLAGCEKREDLPAAINVTVPPRPFNFEVTKTGNTLYSLSWEINDPSVVVKEYRVYLLTGLGPPDLVDSTTDMDVGVDTVLPISGFWFGVSSVSTQNVESDLTTAAAPDTIATANRLLYK